MLQREVAEQILHDHGLSYEAIHGVDRDTVTVRKRYDIAASLRRVCAACGRVRITAALSVAFVASSFVATYTASYGAGVGAIAFAVAAYAAATAPEWAYEPPGPAFEKSNTQGGGLTDRDVALRLAIVNERAEYKQELIDEANEDARREADRESRRFRF